MLSFYLNGFKKIFNLGKKIFLVFAVYFIVISLFLYFINKDKPIVKENNLIKKNRQKIYEIINDPKFNAKTEGKLVISIFRSITCSFIGEGCTDNPDDGDKNYFHSLSGLIGNLIALPYTSPPASGVYWTLATLEKAGFVPKTYAAPLRGIGFAALSPFMEIWRVFRNIAYMILVLVLIAVGFMIMFRMKLNPQTIISIENALPKIVVSLLLITFSFALAGFLIDFMYLLIALAISLLSDNGRFFNPIEKTNQFLTPGFENFLFTMWPGRGVGWGGLGMLLMLGEAIINIIPSFITGVLRLLSGVVIALLLLRFVIPPINKLWEGVTKLSEGLDAEGGVSIISAGFDFQAPFAKGILLPVGIIVLLLITLFLGFALGFYLFPLILAILIFLTFILFLIRIFVTLLGAYIRILLMTIFSPLFMLFEALPGRSAFAWWFKNLLGEILTFPLVIILLLVGYLIVNVPVYHNNFWSPPFLFGLDPTSLSIIIGMAIIFMIPDLIKIAKELMGMKGMPVSVGLGTFFSGVATGYTGAMGGIQLFTSLQQVPVIGQKVTAWAQAKGIIPEPPEMAYWKAFAEKEGFAKKVEELQTRKKK